MPRTIPATFPAAPPAPAFVPSAGRKRRTYAIRTITPVFGGGVDPAVTDPGLPVRATSVRGHLRFWWRATRGARCETAARLHECEKRIWGTVDDPSRVIVERVHIRQAGRALPVEQDTTDARGRPKRELVPALRRMSYVLFPFRSDLREREPIRRYHAGVEFDLVLSCPPGLELDVEAAVWAWVNFGGIGARTRRGCGALYCQEAAPAAASAADLRRWLGDRFARYGLETQAPEREWPTLDGSLLAGPTTGIRDAADAWDHVINKVLADLRQGPDLGRDAGRGNFPGRSRWPEAETIRNATGCHGHPPDPRMSTALPAYPRAEFGLPIVFQFKGSGQGGEPDITQLVPVVRGEERTRMASPLILKPLLTGSGQAVPLVMPLIAEPPTGVALRPTGGPPGAPAIQAVGQRDIRHPRLAAYTHAPMGTYPKTGKPLSAGGCAFDALLEFATKERGYVGVSA